MALLTGRREQIGLIVYVASNMLAADEMVPGWGFHLGLPHGVLYAIAIGGGAAGGALICGPYWIAGLVGGAIGGLGSLLACTAYLASVTTSHSAIMALLGMLGALPGLAVGFGVSKLLPKPATAAMPPAPGPTAK